MADNEEPKKESLDEILSDLNDILNKMPDILDGAKPAEESSAAACPQPEPIPAAEPAASEQPAAAAGMDASGNFERVLDLNDIGRAAEPAKAGGGEAAAQPQPSLPQADAADKTLVIQSLGESMFSGGAEEPAPRTAEPEPALPEQPAAEPAPMLSPVESAVPPMENKAADDELKAEAAKPVEALIMDFKSDAPEAKKEAAAHAGAGLYASTRDFGVPDIDMLLAMSQGETPKAAEAPAPAAEAAVPQTEAAPVPEAGPATPALQAEAAAEKAYAEEIQGIDGLIIDTGSSQKDTPGEPQQEAQPAVEAGGPAAGPLAAEGGIVEFKEEDLKKEEAAQAPAADSAAQPGQGAAAEPAGIISFGPEETPAPAPQPEEEKTIVIQPSGVQPEAEPFLVLGNTETLPAPQPEEEKTIVLQPSGEQPQAEPSLVLGNAEPAAAQVEPGIILGNAEPAPSQIEPGIVLGNAEPAPSQIEPGIVLGNAEPAPAQAEPSLVLGNAEPVLELSVNPPSPQPEEEKTMLILPSGAPPLGEPSLVLGNAAPELGVNAPAPAPEEEKTMMIAPGTDLGATTRSKADLAELSAKATPESVPEPRQRTLALLYSEESKDLCASVLAELDSICAKSQAKPMFIKRAFVKVCEVGMNGNLVQQMATDAKANGLVCVGAIPQETVYEIENAISSSGLMFKHVQRESFSHSAMLDVVTELILK